MKKKENFVYKTYNHAKTRLRYHVIFSTKFRRNCLEQIRDEVLDSFKNVEKNSHIKIYTMEIDGDHIHFLISFPPSYSISQTIRRMKSMSTSYLYRKCGKYLERFYWSGKKILWTHGYFCSTIGEVSEERIKEYIENQG